MLEGLRSSIVVADCLPEVFWSRRCWPVLEPHSRSGGTGVAGASRAVTHCCDEVVDERRGQRHVTDAALASRVLHHALASPWPRAGCCIGSGGRGHPSPRCHWFPISIASHGLGATRPKTRKPLYSIAKRTLLPLVCLDVLQLLRLDRHDGGPG